MIERGGRKRGGIYSPEQGEVYYNGINLESLDKESLYRHTALLSQDFALYPLSLDEPTASLDPVAENELYANFIEMMKGRSCILISHRLAVARYTDRILVLQEGVLIEEGDHASLMQKNGVYASMYHAQSHWYSCRNGRDLL